MSLRLANRQIKGESVHIRLLRPLTWVERVGAVPGGVIPVTIPELKIEAPAEVVAVEPCPPVEAGRGRVITGCFTHLSRDVLELKLSGLDKPLEPTKNHPLFSEDRGDWVPAGELTVGERVRTLHGPATVESVRPKPGVHRVYNVEVEHEHQYLVTKLGVVAHNAYVTYWDGGAKVKLVKAGDYLEGLGDGTDTFGITRAQAVDANSTEYGIHAHHILMQEGPAETQALIEEGHDLLRSVGIDPILGRENLAWAPNLGHPKQLAIDTVGRIRDVIARGGGNDAVTAELQDIATLYAKGHWFGK